MVFKAILLLTLPALAGVADGVQESLVPIALFFADSLRYAERISPDGCRIGFLGADKNGTRSLWVVDADHPETLVRISDATVGDVKSFFWTGGGLVWQTGDSEGTRFFISGLTATGPHEIRTGLTGIVTLEGVVCSADQPVLLLGHTSTSSAFPVLYRLLPTGGVPEPVFINRHHIFSWAFDSNGRPVAGLRWTATGAKEILDLRRDDAPVIFHVAGGDDLRLLTACADGSRVAAITNRDSDLTRVVDISLADGTCNTLASDPAGEVDVGPVVMDGSAPLAVSYSGASERWVSTDTGFQSMLQAVTRDHPGVRIVSAQPSDNHRRWLLELAHPAAPRSVWTLDLHTSRMKQLWQDQPENFCGTLADTKSCDYTARDGCRIPAYLTVPRTGPGPWPLIVFPHGGPHLRTTPGYDGRIQFFASRGYAVLQPNFRGSCGYGKRFMNASDGQWGTGVMQSDLSDGVAEMIRQGITAKNRVAIFGGSYGGYAALAGLAFTPELYAAGACLFGMSDLNEFVSHVPVEWAAYSGDLVRQLGDPATRTGRADLAARSPAAHASAVSAPLLIYHGLRDNLIAPQHAKSMVAALRLAGKHCEFLAGPDEGHGFALPETEMAVYRAAEIFFHEHLGGMIGPEPGERVRARLAELVAAGREECRPGSGKSASPNERQRQ